MPLSFASSRPVLAPCALGGLQRPCSTPSLKLSSGSRRVRRMVAVNSVSLDSVEESINGTIEKTAAAYDATKQVVTELSEKASPAVSALTKFVEAYAPVVKKEATEVSKALAPPVTEAAKGLVDTLKSNGVDTQRVSTVVSQAGSASKSALGSALAVGKDIGAFFGFALSKSDPSLIGVSGLGLLALYLFAPSLGSSITQGIRGYTDDLPASKVVDKICSEKVVLVDIRPVSQQASSGIPDLPRGAKGEVITFPFFKLSNRERGLVKNSERVESMMTALQISNLKKINNKGTPIVIMNSNGRGNVKAVAKCLKQENFSEVYVLQGGFEGWTQSALRTKPLDARIAREAEVLPSGTSGTRLLLPGIRSE